MSEPGDPRAPGHGALALYVLGWVVAGAVLVLAAVLVLGDDGNVWVPALQETELSVAAGRARCELRSGVGRPADEPAVDGPRDRPAAARVYDDEPPRRALAAALRRGAVVISFRPDLADERRDELRRLQEAVPRGTIVAPNRRMRFAVAVTAWRRLLGCGRADRATLDALQLFRGRYLGSGPDSPP